MNNVDVTGTIRSVSVYRDWSNGRGAFLTVEAVLITNQPSAARFASVGTRTYLVGGPVNSKTRDWEIHIPAEIEVGLLRETDFVALLWRGKRESCGKHAVCYTEALVGTMPRLEELFFDDAFADWEAGEIWSATEFVAGFKCAAITKDVRHSLWHALGRSGSRDASHASRRSAWRKVLRTLSLEGCVDLEQDGMRSITIKVARALGWWPSVLPPARWEGVHGSITVIDPFKLQATPRTAA